MRRHVRRLRDNLHSASLALTGVQPACLPAPEVCSAAVSDLHQAAGGAEGRLRMGGGNRSTASKVSSG